MSDEEKLREALAALYRLRRAAADVLAEARELGQASFALAALADVLDEEASEPLLAYQPERPHPELWRAVVLVGLVIALAVVGLWQGG